MMDWFNRRRPILYTAALLIFGAGGVIWLAAGWGGNKPPRSDPSPKFQLTGAETSVAVGRYDRLQDGALFFGEPSVTLSAFSSRLVLWGVVRGRNPQAIVGTDPSSNRVTRMVKPGDQVEGEKIVAIGERFIVVRNASGEGRVELR
jgi:hypothetical protein